MNKLLTFFLLIGVFSFLPLTSAKADVGVCVPHRHVYVHRRCYRPVVYHRCYARPYRHVYVRRYCRPYYRPHVVVYGPRCYAPRCGVAVW